jgi:hypothetical protein
MRYLHEAFVGLVRTIYKKGKRIYDINEAFFEARRRVMNKASILDKKHEAMLWIIVERISQDDASRFWQNAMPLFVSRVRRGYIAFQDLGFTQYDIGKFVRMTDTTEGFRASLNSVSKIWDKAFWQAEEMEDYHTTKLFYSLEPDPPAITACIP